jgi:hypothetical protein
MRAALPVSISCNITIDMATNLVSIDAETRYAGHVDPRIMWRYEGRPDRSGCHPSRSQASAYLLPRIPLPRGVRFSSFAFTSSDSVLSAPLARPSAPQCFFISLVVAPGLAFTNARTRSLPLTANLPRRRRFLPAPGVEAGLPFIFADRPSPSTPATKARAC